MADHSDRSEAQVSDADIEEILERNEAGIADLMAAYEPIERQYFASQVNQGVAPAVTYAIDTTRR